MSRVSLLSLFVAAAAAQSAVVEVFYPPQGNVEANEDNLWQVAGETGAFEQVTVVAVRADVTTFELGNGATMLNGGQTFSLAGEQTTIECELNYARFTGSCIGDAPQTTSTTFFRDPSALNTQMTVVEGASLLSDLPEPTATTSSSRSQTIVTAPDGTTTMMTMPTGSMATDPSPTQITSNADSGPASEAGESDVPTTSNTDNAAFPRATQNAIAAGLGLVAGAAMMF